MPHRLTAKAQSFVKTNGTTPSRELSASDKRSVQPGDVLEAATLRAEGTHFVLTAVQLNGEALPEHLTHVFAQHWEVEELAEKAAASPEAVPAPAAKAPGAKPAGDKAPAEDLQKQVLALLAEGRSVNSIAKELRIGRARIKRWRDGA